MTSSSAAEQPRRADQDLRTDALDARLRAALRTPGEDADKQFAAARKLLLGAVAPAPTEEHVKALIALCEHGHGAERLDVAAQAAARALKLAVQLGDSKLLRHASSVRGIVACESADLTGAIENLCASMEYARGAGDKLGEVVAWLNLASPYLEANLEGLSLACGRRGLDLLDTFSDGESAPFYHGLVSTLNSNVAAAALRMQEHRTGLRAVQRAERRLSAFPAETVNELIGATETHCNYARLLIALNLLDSADIQVRQASEYAGRSGKKSALAAAQLVRGLLEVKRGLVDVGMKRLHEARSMSREHRTVATALRTLAEAHSMVNSSETALTFYRDLSVHNRKWIRDGVERSMASEIDGGDSSPSFKASIAYNRLEHLSMLSELREDTTGGHPYRVGRLAYRLAQALGEPDGVCAAIERGARIHDIGKIGLTSELLLRREDLDSGQRHLIQEHAAGGEALVPECIEDFGTVVAGVRWHHERYDGAGYPDGLRGEAIPLAARIVAISDAFDSLTHQRRQRAALDTDEALHEMRNMRGQPFDPMLFSEFVRVLGHLRNAGRPLDELLQEETGEPGFLHVHRRLEAALLGRRIEGLPPGLSRA